MKGGEKGEWREVKGRVYATVKKGGREGRKGESERKRNPLHPPPKNLDLNSMNSKIKVNNTAMS